MIAIRWPVWPALSIRRAIRNVVLVASVRIHDEDFIVIAAICDSGSVWRPGWLRSVPGARTIGKSRPPCAVRVDHVNVRARMSGGLAFERDLRAIGGPVWVSVRPWVGSKPRLTTVNRIDQVDFRVSSRSERKSNLGSIR